MTSKEWLIHNLYREFEKDKWDLKDILLIMNEVVLTTKKDNYKITMTIKIDEK